MKKLVFRDAAGSVINIGDWDYQLAPVHAGDGFSYAEEPQEDGSYAPVWRNDDREVIAPVMIANNPLPEGASSKQEEVIEGWDGGLYVKGDPRAARS